MHSSLIAWILRAIPFGTIIMYGALGEIVTEKSGNLNLGVPGIMYLGGFAGFASAWAYENTAANPSGAVSVVIAMACAILASMAGGLIYAFLTISLRAVGENPATADAAGINVTLYKYLATCIGAGICGIGGLYYVLDYNQGIWATTGQIEALGWLAVALVIFTTWKPLNAIWGAYLFGMLYWLYQFLPTLLGITMASHITDLVQMLPYVVTIVVLIVVSMRKKKENQPPAHLGLAYFREER